MLRKVIKFGGSSVGSTEAIKKVTEIVASMRGEERPLAIVVSAFEKITDQLISAAKVAASGDAAYKDISQTIVDRHRLVADFFFNCERRTQILNALNSTLAELEGILYGIYLVREASLKTLDMVMSFGERCSAFLISEIFKDNAIQADYLDARILVRTDERFSKAKVDVDTTYENIRNYFESRQGLQVVTGFIGATLRGDTTTLGRGGSDYSASIFGAALGVEEIEIWTDVDGVMTADPRKVEKAFSIDQMTYEEAMELSHFGAKVIYPPTMQPALAAHIPLRIKNTFNAEFPGTLISEKNIVSQQVVKGVSAIDEISLLRIEGSGMVGVPGVSHRLFGALARKEVSVILITQASSEHSICIAVLPEFELIAREAIEAEFALEIQAGQIDEVVVEGNLSIVAAVGENMRHSPGIAGRLFQALGKNGVNIVAIAQGSSELNISAVVSKKDQAKALNVIHEAFFLSDKKRLNLFLVGPGKVGSKLLEQMAEQEGAMLSEQCLEIRLIGVADSNKMLFVPKGVAFANWKKDLNSSTEAMDITQFVKKMRAANLPRSVFVDCTADDNIAAAYKDILSASIAVVTPNKKANSRSWSEYKALKNAAIKSNTKFYYEANVGAGLPVISTLRDLLLSGDEVIKIEAVLSGTLSFIFNAFTGERGFTDVVKEARDKGYTEPDPRDDLSGMDVARKILILAREIGIALELSDVEVENLVPAECRNCSTVEEFFGELSQRESIFDDRLARAKQRGEKLCYIASLANGRATVLLRSIGPEHPFYSLAVGDNVISFLTKRYCERPLVVRGPGAGTDVTAAGVLADIIRLSD